MATRKKTEKQTIKEVAKLIAEETLQATEESKKKPKKAKAEPVKETVAEVYPKVVKGNHLTVITQADGRVELIWDDEALLKEVQDAILSVEQAKKPARKSTRKTKAENA